MWLAQLLECGLLRGSFVPPPVIARLRDLTRYRKKLIEDRAREIQRVQKALEIAGVKLDSVVSDVLGKAARRMLEALISGERDVEVMAEMALTRMRPKIPELQLALESGFDDHNALMLSMHFGHIDHLSAGIERLDREVERELAPFVEQVQRLCTMPGIGQHTAEVVIAEIGVDMSRFPTAGHLASWAGLCPGHHESAGKQRSGKARKGDATLRTALCEAAWSAAKTRDTYLAAQFKRFSRRFGKRNEGKPSLRSRTRCSWESGGCSPTTSTTKSWVATTSSNAPITQPKPAVSCANSNASDTAFPSNQLPEQQQSRSGYARAGRRPAPQRAPPLDPVGILVSEDSRHGRYVTSCRVSSHRVPRSASRRPASWHSRLTLRQRWQFARRDERRPDVR